MAKPHWDFAWAGYPADDKQLVRRESAALTSATLRLRRGEGPLPDASFPADLVTEVGKRVRKSAIYAQRAKLLEIRAAQRGDAEEAGAMAQALARDAPPPRALQMLDEGIASLEKQIREAAEAELRGAVAARETALRDDDRRRQLHDRIAAAVTPHLEALLALDVEQAGLRGVDAALARLTGELLA